MATEVYSVKTITLLNNISFDASPLKIKYLRSFMNKFILMDNVKNDVEAIEVLSECTKIAMQQYMPHLSETIEDFIDLDILYDIIGQAAGIKINDKSEKTVKEQTEEKGQSWFDLDLAKLESEAFMLGIWKNYEELESSLSIPELMAVIASKRELDYEEKKFLAAIQGVDIDKGANKQNEWENLKARVFSKGKTSDGNDVLALQGATAKKAGFGIGFGLDYEDLTKN
jgi:hypothetical protein